MTTNIGRRSNGNDEIAAIRTEQSNDVESSEQDGKTLIRGTIASDYRNNPHGGNNRHAAYHIQRNKYELCRLIDETNIVENRLKLMIGYVWN